MTWIAVHRIFWRVSKWAFIALIILFVIGVATYIFVPRITPAREGCYWTNAMIFNIECPKVPAGKVIAFVLTLPLTVFVYSHMFALYMIGTGIFFESFDSFRLLILGSLALLVVGGVYPIRWLYVKFKSK